MNIRTVRNAMIKRAEDITVNKGDTLGGISKRTGHSIQQLMNWNNIADANTIRAGQTLKTYPGQWRIYQGNTLSGIGKNLGYTTQQMLDANKGINAGALQIGQLINLPKATTTTQPAAAPVAKPQTTTPAATGWTKDWVYPHSDLINSITKIKESRNGKDLYAKGSSGFGWHHMLDAPWTDIQTHYPDKWGDKEKTVLSDEATADDAQKDYLQLIMSNRYKKTGVEPSLFEGLAELRYGSGNIKTQKAVDYYNGLLDENQAWKNVGWDMPEGLKTAQPVKLEDVK